MASHIDVNKATDYADYLIEAAVRHPDQLVEKTTGSNKWKSLDQKLLELYTQESNREPSFEYLKTTSHLLDKLVEKEGLNTLVLNLYPGNEGYSLMIRGRNGMDAETIRLPYEESELLDYVDAEELPPVLTDLLDKAQANLYYSGSVIAEIRDYRRSTNNTYDTSFVLLKPSSHTLLCDMASLTNDGHRWTQEDKFTLESELLLHTSPPLCLEPTPAVFFLNKLISESQKLNTHALKRAVKKFTQAAVNRKRKMAQCPAPKHLALHDFIKKKKDKVLAAQKTKHVDTWKQRDVELTSPVVVDVDKYAKALDKPALTYDNTPKVVEEYTLETERSQGKVYHTRLTISQRMSDEYYFGELYVDRDFTNGPQRGSTCKFQLGTRGNVEKYIKQFTEIITEEGRRSVKITHQIAGQQAVVTYTQTVPHFTPAQPKENQPTDNPQALINHATQLAASIAAQTADKTSQRPVKLSIQINAPGGASTTQLVSPQGAAQGATTTAVALSNVTTLTASSATNAQLLALQQQQQQLAVAAQRARALANRTTTTVSPATTPTGKSQLPTYSQATAMAGSQVTGGTGFAGPSPAKSRRISQPADGLAKALPQGTTVTITQGQIQSTSTTPQPPNLGNTENASQATPTTLSGLLPGVTSLNLANLAGLPPGISLQNLQNIPGLQVSLANVTMAGGIAVPMPLGLINSTASLPSQTGILINSGSVTTRSNTSTTSSTVTSRHHNLKSKKVVGVSHGLTSPPALVTMVTVAPSGATTTLASTTAGTAAVMSTPSNILNLPLGVAGMTQLMTTNLKNTGAIRQGTPLSLLQIPGQQPMQLVSTSLPGARTQLTSQAALSQAAAQKTGEATPATVSGLVSAQLISRPGAMVTSQQLLHLSSPQQLLAIKQQQQQQQLIQLQQQQQQQQQQSQQKSSSSGSHKKSKKKSKNS